MNYAVEMKNIYKKFGSVIANKNVNFNLNHGEIVSLLGENGSGKTTLMNMLAGIYRPDSGNIFIEGKEVQIRSPKDSIELKIGMVHQHFKLVDVFTAAENIILGMDEFKGRLKMSDVVKQIKEIADNYGFHIEPEKKIYNMSVSEKQTVEIIKVLYRGADILILDEPTAVLTPQETEVLFKIMQNMKKDNKSIVIITHKLNEVLNVSDRVVVLRKGENVGELENKNANYSNLTEMMVGKKMSLDFDRTKYEQVSKAMELTNVTVLDKDKVKKLDNVSFEINSGEILGIAGISGSGQKELLEAITGITKIEQGGKIVFHNGKENIIISKLNTRQILKKGIHLAFVPEDRFGMGLVSSQNIVMNVMLRTFYKCKSIFLDFKKPTQMAKKIVDTFSVDTPDIDKTPIRRLSGGNVQKVLVGREIECNPKVLLTAYAVRGLDINTSFLIYNKLQEEKMKGVAVVYVGEDLDVLIGLCDRILVLCGGCVSGIVDARNITKEEIGLLMTTKGGAK